MAPKIKEYLRPFSALVYFQAMRSPTKYVEVLLALAWALLLVAGLALANTPLQVASSAALSCLAWTLKGPHARRLAVGMTLGLLGDASMAVGFIFGGMLFFAACHAFYIAGMFGFAKVTSAGGAKARMALWALYVLIGALVWTWLTYSNWGDAPRGVQILSWASLPYTLFLASTAGVALGLAARNRAFWPLAAGATLFFISDAVIGTRLFRPEVFQAIPEWLRDSVVWVTYGPAQFLIVTSSRAAAYSSSVSTTISAWSGASTPGSA